jgi:hypothetical protein
MQTHEPVSSFRKVSLGSNRKFGLTFGAVFLFLGVLPLIRGEGAPSWIMAAVSMLFFALAIAAPDLLGSLNRAWFKLGLGLSRIANPIMMGFLFFGVVVPFAWYMRWRRRDPLHLAIDPEASSYWIERQPPGPIPGNLSKQF